MAIGSTKLSPEKGRRLLTASGRKQVVNTPTPRCPCFPCQTNCTNCAVGDPPVAIGICSVVATVSGWVNPGCISNNPCTEPFGGRYCADMGTGVLSWHITGTLNGTYIFNQVNLSACFKGFDVTFHDGLVSNCNVSFMHDSRPEEPNPSFKWWQSSIDCLPGQEQVCDEVLPDSVGNVFAVQLRYQFGLGWVLCAGACLGDAGGPTNPQIGIVCGTVEEEFEGELACADTLVFECRGACGQSATVVVSITYDELCSEDDPFWFYYGV